MNMNTDELDSPNNSNNEHLDKTVNDATSKTEGRFKSYHIATQKNLLKITEILIKLNKQV